MGVSARRRGRRGTKVVVARRQEVVEVVDQEDGAEAPQMGMAMGIEIEMQTGSKGDRC